MPQPESAAAEALHPNPHPSGVAPRPGFRAPASGEGMAVPEQTGAETLSPNPHPTVSAARTGSPSAASGEGKKEPFFYGGQAVIEGVMMRGKRHYAVAVRLPNTKEIVVDRGELKAPIYTNPVWKLPFVRGLALIGEQLHLGMKSLIWSANMNAGAHDVQIGKREITGSVALAGVFALALFIGLPLLLASLAIHRSGSFSFVLVESRVLAIPLIAGTGFELIRYMARHRYNPVVRIALLPVLGTQKFTTREPSDDMLEVAICAFNSARQGEEEAAGAAA